MDVAAAAGLTDATVLVGEAVALELELCSAVDPDSMLLDLSAPSSSAVERVAATLEKPSEALIEIFDHMPGLLDRLIELLALSLKKVGLKEPVSAAVAKKKKASPLL